MQKQSQLSNEESECCQLKIDLIEFDRLLRNDLIFYQNDIWRCQSINMNLFQNMSTKEQRKLTIEQIEKSTKGYLRIEKLQLIPKQWKYQQIKQEKNIQPNTKIILKGQQLGLGPIHQIEVTGMRKFQELEVVRSEKQKGRDLPFKVILCKTKKSNCYLISGIDFLS